MTMLQSAQVGKILNWKVKEIVQVGPEFVDGKNVVPLQLLSFESEQRPEEGEKTSLWFLGGFEGLSKVDSHMMSLLQKAVTKASFGPAVDLYITPLANPSGSSKSPKLNSQGVNISENFISSRLNLSAAEIAAWKHSAEAQQLLRWSARVQPRAIITFTSSTVSRIRHLGVPTDIVSKLAALAERPAFEFGTEPELTNEDGATIPRENIANSFGAWCADQGIAWINFTIDTFKKDFDQIRETEWKPSVGPALKWLVEGQRFNPPKAEPPLVLPKVIPVLDIPAELGQL